MKKESSEIKLLIYDFDQTIASKDVSVFPTRTTLKHYFGSEKRQDRLRAHFEWIKKHTNLKMVVLTYNNKDCVGHCFEMLGLKKILPVEVYDWGWMNARKMYSKGEAIKFFKNTWRVTGPQTLFVDDSNFNIDSAKAECIALQCATTGMSIKLFDEIEKRIDKGEECHSLQAFVNANK